jgi:hypothetical protein
VAAATGSGGWQGLGARLGSCTESVARALHGAEERAQGGSRAGRGPEAGQGLGRWLAARPRDRRASRRRRRAQGARPRERRDAEEARAGRRAGATVAVRRRARARGEGRRRRLQGGGG